MHRSALILLVTVIVSGVSWALTPDEQAAYERAMVQAIGGVTSTTAPRGSRLYMVRLVVPELEARWDAVVADPPIAAVGTRLIKPWAPDPYILLVMKWHNARSATYATSDGTTYEVDAWTLRADDTTGCFFAIIWGAKTESTAAPQPAHGKSSSASNAIQVDGVTMVPIRFICESLGAKVNFDAKAGRICIQYQQKTITLRLGGTTATVDGQARALQAPPIERAGLAYVPLRFTAEVFGATVEWDALTQQATILPAGSDRRLTIGVGGSAGTTGGVVAAPAAAASPPPPALAPPVAQPVGKDEMLTELRRVCAAEERRAGLDGPNISVRLKWWTPGEPFTFDQLDPTEFQRFRRVMCLWHVLTFLGDQRAASLQRAYRSNGWSTLASDMEECAGMVEDLRVADALSELAGQQHP